MPLAQKQYHILNGDALKEQFPAELNGEIIVARECLVDGDVKSETLEELFQIRARFITEFYGEYSEAEYHRDSVSEFKKVMDIPENSMVHLWFEDDLFCQVNFWFISYLLFHHTKNCEVFLIRPKVHTPYGFGGLSNAELLQAFREKTEVKNLGQIAHLWELYQNDDLQGLSTTAEALKEPFPFLLEAVKAHIERIPSGDNPGRPSQALIDIMEELDTDKFGPVFMEFNKRESIYGFGDLQVKRLFDEVKKNL